MAILTGKVDFSCNNRHSTVNDCKSYTDGDRYQLYSAIYWDCFFKLSGGGSGASNRGDRKQSDKRDCHNESFKSCYLSNSYSFYFCP